MDIVGFFVKRWWIFALALILLVSYEIRAFNITPDRLLSYDPIFMYRYTKYFADFGTMPLWDELTYYTGRSINGFFVQPLMHYMTAAVYWTLGSAMSWTLKTTAAYMSAVYGALIALSAFLLAREMSNKYGGIMAAILVSTAPQVLSRTFGSSYDSDQIVMLFMLLSLYAGFHLMNKKTIPSYCLALGVFTAFLLSWNMFWFTFFIMIGFLIVNFVVGTMKKGDDITFKDFGKNFVESLRTSKIYLMLVALLGLGIAITGTITNMSLLDSLNYFMGFAGKAEAWIVNISIAELQPVGQIWLPYLVVFGIYIGFFILSSLLKFNKKLNFMHTFIIMAAIAVITLMIFGSLSYKNDLTEAQRSSVSYLDYFTGSYVQNISMPFGRFLTDYALINTAMLTLFVILIGVSMFFSLKGDNIHVSFIMTLIVISLLVLSKGIRFSEYTSAILLVLVANGFGSLIEFSMAKNDSMLKALSFGLIIFIAIMVLNIGIQAGQTLGPDQSSNWESAWDFLRLKTPELSLVGTWWDPGHMITGLGERRVIADGAHCDSSCLYTINDRIVDLGKIMATSDENTSLNLIRKYQGTSPSVYWIASDDLIGKFQWLQYFGMGCDARSDQSCPLYIQLAIDKNNPVISNAFFNYPMSDQSKLLVYNAQVPIPIYVQGINAILFDEVIYYNNSVPVSIKFTQEEKDSIIAGLKPAEQQLNVRFSNQTIPMSVWVPTGNSYIVIIPPNLRQSVFTKMFMLEGQGLDHFKQVFRNDQVKIYEVV